MRKLYVLCRTDRRTGWGWGTWPIGSSRFVINFRKWRSLRKAIHLPGTVGSGGSHSRGWLLLWPLPPSNSHSLQQSEERLKAWCGPRLWKSQGCKGTQDLDSGTTRLPSHIGSKHRPATQLSSENIPVGWRRPVMSTYLHCFSLLRVSPQ